MNTSICFLVPNQSYEKNKPVFFITLSLVVTSKASSLETKLSPQGSDKYNFLITGDDKSSEKKLRDVFQNKVNEVCGTRFEIISIKMII